MPKAKKTVYLNISIWYNEEKESIFIANKEHDKITSVNNIKESARYHKHLFNQLKNILIKEGKFPLNETNKTSAP